MSPAPRFVLAALFAAPFAVLVAASAPTAVAAQAAGALVEVAKASLTIPPEVRIFRIASTHLRETRQVRVVLPPSFANTPPERRYPVIVVFDGESLAAIVHDVANELLKHGQVPEAVIIGIENFGADGRLDGGMKRVFDLTPPGLSVAGSDLQQGGDRMLDFIERELLPAIDREFRTGEPRIMVGHSSGGVLATYAAATRPAFRIAISLDAPIHLQENWLAEKLTARASAGGKPIRYASLDARFGWPEDSWNRLVSKAPASWRLSRQDARGRRPRDDDDARRLHRPARCVRRLLTPRCARRHRRQRAQVLRRHQRVPRRECPSAAARPRTGVRPFDEHKIPSAKATWAAIIAGYGRPSNAARMEGRIAQAERAPPPAETVDGLLATPFPTPEQARAYIGEWVGDLWAGENAPRQNALRRLRVRVEGGKVIGETIRRGPQGEVVRRWEYLRITANGMTWGALNGMEPRGVALFEGVLRGEELSGAMRLAGLAPGTDTGPPLHFSFTRVKP